MATTSSSQYLFYAEMAKGNIIKVLTEAISKSIGRVRICLSPQGINIIDSDTSQTIIYNCDFPREHFKKYSCSEKMCISVLSGHLYKNLKSVKKKDSVTLFINNAQEGTQFYRKIGIQIRPESKDEMSRLETDYIVYNDESNFTPLCVPDMSDYAPPMKISASEFQKIKKLTTSSCRYISLQIQRDNYLVFSGDENSLSFLSFGELSSEPGGMYSQKFNKQNFDMIVKLPGLCSEMQFYAPLPEKEGYPLMIKINAIQNQTLLGKICIFIKDAQTIEYETKLNCDLEGTELLFDNSSSQKRGRRKN